MFNGSSLGINLRMVDTTIEGCFSASDQEELLIRTIVLH